MPRIGGTRGEMSDRSSDDRTAVTTRKRSATSSGDPPSTSTGPFAIPKQPIDASPASLPKRGRKGRRYRIRKLLGRGGMGEIHLARDQRVGRSVALKVMLEDAKERPDTQWRFLREARVQGQLEHPAIVPVYDIGWDRSGRAYFAMKRIGGVTLSDILRELRARNEEYEKKYSLRRLLSIFQQVCLAVDYAHVRGVVHRDLKPSNIMLGDFGEVYVLDWGIAKLLASDDPSSSILEIASDDSDATSHGEVLGTVGYMAPEQITSASGVDARADVYSLGAVLFQLLTLEPLHGRGSIQERARSTHEGPDARASRRAPARDIAPELDAICQKATALDPLDRFESARALHDAVERFLEGDRDARLRSELAEQHVEKARAASQRALGDGPDAAEQRKLAVREAGRALALDPKNEAAAGIVARLVLEPPKELPEEVRDATRAVFGAEVQRAARLGALTLLGVAMTTLVVIGVGIRSWAGMASIIVPLLGAAAYAGFMYKADIEKLQARAIVLSIFISMAIAGSSGLVGALFLTPVYTLAFAVVVTVLHGLGRYRLPMIGLACAAWLVPVALEWAGWLPPSYRFEDNTLTILPGILNVPETPVRIALIAANLGTIVLICAMLWRFAAAVAENRERVQLTAWHLQQLAPDEHERAPQPELPPDPPDEITRR